MNLRDLEYIAAVCDFGSFSKAANACHVSQPALSAQVRKLEQELGVQIFERGREMRATAAGTDIIKLARETMMLVERIQETAKAAVDPFSGGLSLGVIPTIGPYIAPILLRAMRHSLPNVKVRLVEEMTAPLETMLASGELDAAITATKPEDPHQVEVSLYEEPFWVALPMDHPLTSSEEIDLKDINIDELLLLKDGHCLRDQILGFVTPTSKGASSFNTQQTSLTTILSMVGASAGVTIVPSMSLSGPWMTDAGIVTRREKTGAAFRDIRLVYRKTFPGIALLMRMADMICAVVPDTVRPARR